MLAEISSVLINSCMHLYIPVDIFAVNPYTSLGQSLGFCSSFFIVFIPPLHHSHFLRKRKEIHVDYLLLVNFNVLVVEKWMYGFILHGLSLRNFLNATVKRLSTCKEEEKWDV